MIRKLLFSSASPSVIAHSISSSARLKLWCAVVLLASTSAFAITTDQKANPGLCGLSDDDAAGLSRDLGTDVYAVRVYKDTISGMLHERNFEQLDCVADHARSNQERFPGGMWKLHELYKGLSEPVAQQHATEEDWKRLLELLQSWIAEQPKSITARVALASAWINYAWDARGRGYSDKVSESGWTLFTQRTEEAQRVLKDASETLPAKCPEWYVVMQNVAQNEDWNGAEMRSLFDEAYKFEPGYYYYARALAYLLLPKWGGAPGDTEKFVQEIADHIGREQGDIFYFQVASSNDLICGCQDQPEFSWERIKRGYEASQKQYGLSMLNLNRMAYLAVHYGETDPIFADQAFTRIGDQWDEEVWKSERDFRATQSWATQMVPITIANRAKEAAAQDNLQTPEGARYQLAFEKAYRGLLNECVRTDGANVSEWKGKFETMIMVGGNGFVEDGGIHSVGPIVMCMYQKMRPSHEQRSPLFPPPPKPSYWVRVDLDWSEFAPVAPLGK
ncbi:MAG: DUF4034 domain-containing protein [Candidatus Sulfotelmatobacter sp.]